MGKRGPQPTYTELVRVGLRPEVSEEVRRLAGEGHGALSRWLREAVDQRLQKEGKAAVKV
jgi:hypothetical protein